MPVIQKTGGIVSIRDNSKPVIQHNSGGTEIQLAAEKLALRWREENKAMMDSARTELSRLRDVVCPEDVKSIDAVLLEIRDTSAPVILPEKKANPLPSDAGETQSRATGGKKKL